MKKLLIFSAILSLITLPSIFLGQQVQAPGGVNFGNKNILTEISGNGVPTGSCSYRARYIQLDAVAGANSWECINGGWVNQGGSSSSGVASVTAILPLLVNGGAGPVTGAATVSCPTCGGGSGGVPSVNGITSAVTILAGANMGVATVGDNITLSSTGGGAGVPSVNGITNAVTILAGANMGVATVGDNITLSSTGSGGGYILPPATTSTLGGVKADGVTTTVAVDGTISSTSGLYTIPVNTNVLVGFDSRNLVSTTCQSTGLSVSGDGSITSGSIAGGVFTATSINNDIPGTILTLSQFTGAASVLNGQVITLLPTPTPTSFTANVTGITTLSSTGSGMSVCTNIVPTQLSREPVASHANVINVSSGNYTTTMFIANFASIVGPYYPSVTGKPALAILQGGAFDALSCDTAASIEANLQTIWGLYHSQGIPVMQSTLIPVQINDFCPVAQMTIYQVNNWLKTQGPTQVATGNSSWDNLVDLGGLIWDPYNPLFMLQTGTVDHPTDAGASRIADALNAGIANPGSMANIPGGVIIVSAVEQGSYYQGFQLIDPPNNGSMMIFPAGDGSTGTSIDGWGELVNDFLFDFLAIRPSYTARVMPSSLGAYGFANSVSGRLDNFPPSLCMMADSSMNGIFSFGWSGGYGNDCVPFAKNAGMGFGYWYGPATAPTGACNTSVTSPIGSWISSRDGKLTYCNSSSVYQDETPGSTISGVSSIIPSRGIICSPLDLVSGTCSGVVTLSSSSPSISYGVGAPTAFIGTHSYWRVTVDAVRGSFAVIGELQFREVSGVNEIPVGGSPIESSEYSSGWSDVLAYDGDFTTGWAPTTTISEWIGYHFGTARSVSQLAIAPMTGRESDVPSGFTVSFSDDNVAYTNVLSETSVPIGITGVFNTYTIPGGTPNNENDIYYDTSGASYIMYVFHLGAWHQIN